MSEQHDVFPARSGVGSVHAKRIFATQESKEQAAAMRQAGLAFHVIGAEFGCTATTVQLMLRNAGAPDLVSARYWTADAVAELVALRAQGWTYRKLAEKFDRTEKAIAYVLTSNVDRHKIATPRTNKQPPPQPLRIPCYKVEAWRAAVPHPNKRPSAEVAPVIVSRQCLSCRKKFEARGKFLRLCETCRSHS